ncbi:transposase, partial [Staphylococcus aureus]|uniref:IS110 family transposase n=1 Tax=Staphylococcus aureus TaxID=1280 RepID=UPI00211BE19C
VVNPMHVKRIKELDDNSPSKNDTKDARVIAQLIKDGRYSVPNLPEGVYAELRQGMKMRDQLSSKLQEIGGQIDNWLDRFFPEFSTVFKDWQGKAALHALEHFPLPCDIKPLDMETLTSVRGIGLKKAKALKHAAERSV